MALNREDRRALRAIEQRLSREDPSLARRLRTPPAPTTVLDRIAWSYFSVSILLLGYGLVLDDAQVLRGAGLLFGMFAPFILVLNAAFHVSPHGQWVAGRLPR